jgi:Holliday junction resolvase RusA-like endonuclease
MHPSPQKNLTMPIPIRHLLRLECINRMFNARDDIIVMSNNKMTTVSLTILGEPVSQPQTQSYHSQALARVIVIDPAKDQKLAFKKCVRDALEEVGATLPIFDNNVKVMVTATFHVVDTRKDIDNLLKFLLDALTSVVYSNDNMVYSVITTRNLEYLEFMLENIVQE